MASFSASAQFYSAGDDPASLRWYTVSTKHYKIIYPAGQDSLSRVYAASLEKYWQDTQASVAPLKQWKWKMPVVLHGATSYANGSVLWSPRQMDLYTVGEAYGPEAFPWETNLAIHESRHVMQMLNSYRGLFGVLRWVIGDMAPGAFSALYPNTALLEGDAVVAETALSAAGRGRSADFLNYYRIAFNEGDWRNWYRWRYGSYRHYAPDHYALGYMTIAGMRAFYDAPMFMREYFDGVVRHPLRIANLSRTIKAHTGKNLRKSYRDIMERFHKQWVEDEASRAPFMEMRQVTPTPAFHTDYLCGAVASGHHYVIREGLLDEPSLGELLPGGKFKRIGSFASHTSSLFHDPVKDIIYWSETVPHPRWSLSQTSRIRYYSPSDHKFHDLTRKGRLYNPCPSPDGEELSVAEYPFGGGSNIVILSTSDGSAKARFHAPSGLQVFETAWLDDDIYALGLSDGGIGLYRVSRHGDGAFEQVLRPSPSKIQNLGASDDFVEMVSDYTGVNELYRYYPSSGKTFRISHTRYGATDFTASECGDSLHFSSPTSKGMMVYSAPVKDFYMLETDLSAPRPSLVPDILSDQENALAAKEGRVTGEPAPEFSVTEPRRYRRLLHPAKIHAWAPLYVNYDEISEFSGDLTWSTAAPGATVFFQNTIGGSFSGYAGYAYKPNTSDGKTWRHTGHLKLTYSGLFPVFTASLDVGDRLNRQYTVTETVSGEISAVGIHAAGVSSPLVSASLKAYVPLNFSEGGIHRGLVPSVSCSISNDRFNPTIVHLTSEGAFHGDAPSRFSGADIRENRLMSAVTMSLRGYILRQKAESKEYPSLGIGLEAGYFARPGAMSFFTPAAYVYSYGYVPGFSKRHGVRLTATYQHLFYGKRYYREIAANTLPRGFSSSLGQYVAALSPDQVKATVDYAVPVYVGDLSFLGPVMYIKNFMVAPHFDFMGTRRGSLFSAGASLTAVFSNFLWLPFDGELGVRAGYNGGSLLRGQFSNLGVKRYYVEAVFRVDI